MARGVTRDQGEGFFVASHPAKTGHEDEPREWIVRCGGLSCTLRKELRFWRVYEVYELRERGDILDWRLRVLVDPRPRYHYLRQAVAGAKKLLRVREAVRRLGGGDA